MANEIDLLDINAVVDLNPSL